MSATVAFEISHRRHFDLQMIRDVWCLVSTDSRITIRTIASKLGIANTDVYFILKLLEQAGYIEHKKRHSGRKVLVPLIERRLT